jgi:hypothetical protein
VFCKSSGGRKAGNSDSSMCKCSHCIVAVCVPCVLAAAGVRAAEDEVAPGSIGEAEAAEAAAHWPDGLCYWCSSAQQGLLVSPAVSPQKAAAPARAELLLEPLEAACAVAGTAARSAADAGQQQTGDRARQAAAAAFPQRLLQPAGEEAIQAAVDAFSPQQQQLLQEALQAVLSAFGSQAAAQPQGSQAMEADTEPSLEHSLAQHTQIDVPQRQSSHASMSADGSGGPPAAAAANGARAAGGRCSTHSSTDDSAAAAAAHWVPSPMTAVEYQQQQQNQDPNPQQQQQQQLTYWASDDLDAEQQQQQPQDQPQEQQQPQPQEQQQPLQQPGEGAEVCAPCGSPKPQAAVVEAAAAAAGVRGKRVRQPRCGSCYSCLNRHLKKGCYAVKVGAG